LRRQLGQRHTATISLASDALTNEGKRRIVVIMLVVVRPLHL
jgi:hypothetical protein